MFGAIPGSLVTVVTVLLLVGGTGCSACVAHVLRITMVNTLSNIIVSVAAAGVQNPKLTLPALGEGLARAPAGRVELTHPTQFLNSGVQLLPARRGEDTPQRPPPVTRRQRGQSLIQQLPFR